MKQLEPAEGPSASAAQSRPGHRVPKALASLASPVFMWALRGA